MTTTPEHCLTVAAWMDSGGGLIGGVSMVYQQSTIDCGTACCAVGALSFASGRGHADSKVFDAIVDHELPALGKCYAAAGGGWAMTAQDKRPSTGSNA